MARKNHRREPAKAEASFPLIRDGPYGMRMRSDHIYQCEAILTRQGQPRNAAHQGGGNSSQLSFFYPRHPTNDEGAVYWKEGTKSGHIFRTAHAQRRTPVGHLIPPSIAGLKIRRFPIPLSAPQHTEGTTQRSLWITGGRGLIEIFRVPIFDPL